MQEVTGPSLTWERDDDGDLIVRLVGMPHWHILGHGKTHGEALACIGAALAAAGDPHEPGDATHYIEAQAGLPQPVRVDEVRLVTPIAILTGDDRVTMEIEMRREAEAQARNCDCGQLLTRCASCVIGDYQAEHPECPTCCPVAPQRFEMRAHLQRQREWSERTFGPGERTAGVVDHIRKELREIEAAPHDIEEWIDVVILALDGAWRAGASPDQIIATLQAKQAKNEARTWPDWRTQPLDQAITHVKEGEPHQVSEGGTPEDAAYWERRNAIKPAAPTTRGDSK